MRTCFLHNSIILVRFSNANLEQHLQRYSALKPQ